MIIKENINSNYVFPQKNLNVIEILDELNFCNSKILDIQKNSTLDGNCYLSFYPLAKNIRFISSHFYKSIKGGLKPITIFTLSTLIR